MNEQFTAQFRTEGQPAFPVENTETETTTDSPSDKETTTTDPAPEGEQTPAEQTPDEGKPADGAEDKDKGFADHPRWKEREADWTKRFNEQETRHTEEITKVTTSIQTQIAEALKAAGVGEKPAEETTALSEEVPAWFGGDEKQWAEFQKWNNGLISQAEERGAQKAMKGIEEKTAAEAKAIEDATTYMNSEIAVIESDKTINPQGVKVDKNKLLKFTIDNDLVDSNGRWNYKAAFKLMNGTSAAAPTNGERKKIAAETTSDRTPEVKADPVTSSTDFSKPGARPW